jgi:hypothetical protein
MKKFTQKFVGIAAMFCAISLSSNAQEIGDQAEGGTVFHIDEASGLGYVVASQDLSSGAYDTSQPGDLGYEWGCYGVNVSTGLGIGSGMNNTNLIANNCNSNNGIIAAQAALNHSSGGYDDWFLPSRDEFLAMTSFEDFNDGWYFSSSQFSSTTQAWFVAPNNDDQNASSKKIFTLQVRPIRTFDWSPLVVAECGNQMDGSSRSGGEFCMPCMDGTFSPDDLSDCMSVSECYPGEYETTVATATSNRVCSPVSECYPDEYETMAPTPTSDRECTVLSTCLSDEFVSMAATTTSDRLCSPVRTICASDEYVSVAASPGLSDIECSPVRSICTSDEYISMAAISGLSDIQCSPVRTSCSSGEFVSVASLPGLSDIECSELRDCTAGEYESVAPTATSNRVCSPVSECSPDEYETVAPTPVSDRECSVLSTCLSDEYESIAPTETSDRVCETIVVGCMDATAYNYNAAANTVPSLSIGEESDGGYVYQINDNGTAFIVATTDNGAMRWELAMDLATNSTRGGYEDWTLPSIAQLYEIRNTMGPGSGNNLGTFSSHYWSSQENHGSNAQYFNFTHGASEHGHKDYTNYVRLVRTATMDDGCVAVVNGCTDSSAFNYNDNANTDDNSCEAVVEGCMDEADYNYNVRANTSDNSCSTACFYPEFMDSNSDFESPNIGPGDVLYVYYNNEYITHFTTSTSDVVSGSTPGYSGYGPRYFGSEHEPGVSYYAGGLSALTSINEANYPYWVGAGDEYIFDTRSFSEGGDTHDGVGNFSWINWTSKNIKISQSRCFGATSCTVDQFELLAPTPTSDRECTVLSTCLSDEFVSMAATTTSDRLCSPIRTICVSDEYVSVAALPGLSDIECSELSDCTAGEYESLAPTSASDRACSSLSECSAYEYELVAATTTSDRICETIVKGCTDAAAYNFDSNANTDDGSCETLDLPAGWSMFGFTCIEPKDVKDAFDGYAEKIIIVKDEMGLSYLPEYNFNALGNLKHTEGYQIKLKERLVGFKFCEPIGQVDVDAAYAQGVASVTPDDGVSQADVDAAEAAVHASYEGWCASDLDNDGLCDDDEVSGCMDETACNYNSEAGFDDGSCDYETCLDECGVVNGDNTTCLDCVGVPNGTAEDLGCGCGNPAAQEGYDCEGNEITSYQVGDLAIGGIVFYIDETGQHGLVAALEDLTEGATDPWWYGFNGYEWGCYGTSISGADGQAIGTGYQNTLDIVNQACTTENGGITAAQAALDAEINGYSDWYIPSKDELIEMYNTIGNGGSEGNIGGFVDDGWPYWSSSEFNSYVAWYVYFDGGYTGGDGKGNAGRVRVIRAF